MPSPAESAAALQPLRAGRDSPTAANPWTPSALAGAGPLAWVAANLAVALAYFILGLVVSRFFAAYGLFPAPIWLPASVAMVAAMVGGLRMLPGIFLGSFLANAALFAPPLHVTAMISATNALGPVAAALLLRWLGFAGRLFTSFAGVSAFLLCSTLLSPAISALGGAVALGLGRPFDPAQSYAVWLSWWLSDSGGTLYLACALILWLGLERNADARLGPAARLGRRELAVWALAAVSSLALFLTPALHGADLRVGFPFLLAVPISWIALRMSLRSAYTLVSLVAAVATVGTVAGLGPFHDDGALNPLALVGALVVLLAMNVLTIAALANERHEAENARRVKSMFLAQTSHELRAPLNAIIGFSSLLEEQALGRQPNPDYRSYARHIQQSGEHLLALIGDLLEMSKIEAGQLELQIARMPLAEAFESAAAMVEPQALAKGLALSVAAPPELDVDVDPKAFRQILLNLLSNAVKFTPQDGRVTLSAELEADGGLAIRVADTGVGVPAEALDRLFAPFARAHRAAVDGVEGTGLGLCIAKGLVELHGGAIALESEPGRGTTVTVRLPAARVAPRGAAAA